MITTDEYTSIMDIKRAIDMRLSTKVYINHEQVTEIVVSDLLSKYNGNINNEWGDRFKEILRFYLTDDELEQFGVEI